MTRPTDYLFRDRRTHSAVDLNNSRIVACLPEGATDVTGSRYLASFFFRPPGDDTEAIFEFWRGGTHLRNSQGHVIEFEIADDSPSSTAKGQGQDQR